MAYSFQGFLRHRFSGRFSVFYIVSGFIGQGHVIVKPNTLIFKPLAGHNQKQISIPWTLTLPWFIGC
jgi:hypothetical protein